MKGLLADIRHALRVYARTPVASGLSVVVLAVAMAFVSAFLALYIDLAHTGHPGFDDSSELVTVGQNNGNNIASVPLRLIDRVNEEVGSLAAMSGFTQRSLELGSDRETRQVELVSERFFGDMRPRLRLGRGFGPSDHEPDAEPVAVISYDYWQNRFAGSREAIDQTVAITGMPQFNPPGPDGQPQDPPEATTTEFRIIGVLGPELPSMMFGDSPVWLPFEVAAPLYVGPWETVRDFQLLRGLGRLAPGATPEAVAAELNTRYEDSEDLNLAPDVPFDAYRGLAANVNTQRDAERQLRLFLAGSVLLALVAAANVSLFLLSRAPGRRRELGIRMSVGAPLKRLGRQLATEAGSLVVVSTALGSLVSFWLQSYLQSQPFFAGAQWRSASLVDWRVLVLLVSFLALLTLLVSLAPVLDLKKLGIAASTRQVAARANLTQRIACTAQIAIAGTVAAAAIAFGWYLGLLVTADHGYETRDIHTVMLEQQPVTGGAPGAGFSARLVERERRREVIEAIPGVEDVGFGTAAPAGSMGSLLARIPRPVPPGDTVQFAAVAADRSYFEMLDIDLLDGQLYEGDEGDVMLVNEAAAELIWGTFDVTGESLPISISDAASSEIVGVVADVSYGHPEDDAPPQVFVPVMPFFGAEIVLIKSALSPAELRTALQAAIDSGELEFAIQSIDSLSNRVSSLIAADRARSLLTIVSAAVVVLLAGVGFYGTQRYLVASGRREYAIRASLGAGPGALGRIVMRRALGLSLPGVVLGGLLGFIVAAWLRDDFVSPDVGPGVVTTAVVLGLVVLLVAASLGPARQAKRTLPARCCAKSDRSERGLRRHS